MCWMIRDAVDIWDNEKCTRELEKMVEAMKGAVGMDMQFYPGKSCAVSLYSHNVATRKARRQLAATSEQSGTRAKGDSVWLANERYGALFRYGTKRKFTFCFDRTCQDLTLQTFVRKLGLSIAQNANSVEILQVKTGYRDAIAGSAKQLLSLDVWKEAFPSLQGVSCTCLSSDDVTVVSPHLMKHVRCVTLVESSRLQMITPGYLDLIGSMIRKNVIEEINVREHRWLCHSKLLDETLRSVRSFVVRFFCLAATATAWDFLARSFERTKADGDKLERFSVSVPEAFFSTTAFERIIRSRPNLQVLNVYSIDAPDFVGVCQAVASSTLITFECTFQNPQVEAAVATVGQLLQHSTIRDLQLCVDGLNDPDSFVQGIAEGLRTTRLRRFHLVIPSRQGVSIGSMTKLYESVRENRSLMDIQLKGTFWDPWREPEGHDLPHAPPCPFSFFEFLSSRNQYLSQLLLPHESTLPAGLWPLILESASCDASILYYLLTSQPHLVKGKVEGTVAADREWGVDGPARKCRSIA